MAPVNRVVIVGGGPGGYESALVAAQLGADVTVVDSDGLGGSAVLTDCVPSKTLIATADLMADMEEAADSASPSATPARAQQRGQQGRPGLRQRAREDARAGAVHRHRAAAHPGEGPGWCAAAAASTGPSAWSRRSRTAARDHRGRRRAHRHRGQPAHPPHGAAGRGADPHLGAGLRPRRGPRAADRGRLRRDRRGVRRRLQRARSADVVLVSSRDRVLPGRTRTPRRSSRRSSSGAG